MSDVTLVFPHQLFTEHPAIISGREVFIIEDDLFFHQYKFHQKKILLHRASMKHYEAELKKLNITVTYINASEGLKLKQIFSMMKERGAHSIHYADVHDYLLERRIIRYAVMFTLKTHVYESPAFVCTSHYLNDYFSKQPRYFLNDFYIDQRKRLSMLTDKDDPVGGKWSFDQENRKQLPENIYVPPLPDINNDEFTQEAKVYVKKYFSDHVGSSEDFNYPVTRTSAVAWLDSFLTERFNHYGAYQDAILAKDSFLFHSVLSPVMNIGLLTPDELLDKVIELGIRDNVPINAVEGLIRQILGWREFVRAVYMREGVRQRTSNHWKHSRKIPVRFWKGNTGIDPVDNVIKKATRTGYTNHIERLMIMGNFMLLCEFDPDEVYRWFMEFYIDSYDWVMVPNVYGMSQFADGGLMSTKPYISGSNYILKMSNFKKGPWCDIWDALYWGFIAKHKNMLIKNHRMSMMVVQLNKMHLERFQNLQKIRQEFLENLEK